MFLEKLIDNSNNNKKLNTNSILNRNSKFEKGSLLTSLEFVFYINIFEEPVIIEDLLLYADTDLKNIILKKNYIEYRLRLFFDYNKIYNYEIKEEKEINFHNKLILINNAFIEHSLKHKDNIIHKNKILYNKKRIKNSDCLNYSYLVHESLANIYIPIIIRNLSNIFNMIMPENFYFFLKEKKDLYKINCILLNIFDNFNMSLYSSDIFLIKLELKRDKFNWIYSLYGLHLKENKYKFLFYFEINYFKIFDHYLENIFDFNIKNIYYHSIYNKYFWETNNILEDDDSKINKKREYIKKKKLDGFDRWRRMQGIKFSIENIEPKIESVKRMLDYIYDEKEIGGSSVWLENQEKENEKLFIELNIQLNKAKKRRIKIKEWESLNDRNYLKYVESNDCLLNINLWKKWKGIYIKNNKESLIISNKLKFIDFKKSLEKLNLLKKIDERKK